EGPAEETHRLSLSAEGPRISFSFRAADGDRVLWALDRKEEAAADAEAAGERRPDAAEAEAAPAHPATAPAASPDRPPPRPAVVEFAHDEAAREALRARIESAFHEDFRREIDRMLREAERMLRRREQALEGDKKAAEDHLLDRRRGEILLSYYAEIPRGASRVELPDPYADSPGSRVRLVLDPALSPHDNAARFFQKAKKGERGLALVERRLARTRKNVAEVAEVRRVVYAQPPKEALSTLDAFFREAALDLSARGERRGSRLLRRSSAPPRAERPERRSPGAHRSTRPRTFVTRDGWAVWVGRNNTDNDLITHRLSQPHDYWFHVVGVPGSHVILRRPTRTAVPTPRTLEEAASIAAYFSKARKLTRVPVIYTERKFVSKPRRGKPGQALATRERELLVRPRLPEGSGTGTEDDREVSG
ncbi:MAG TPA: NFACT RNA binding domain-containing protein, partial [Candidatus Eisenbacteria bacterium]|nr:NFACT RNA binding domain-containing protein [Candidatus Eisenbacteria bacterium]